MALSIVDLSIYHPILFEGQISSTRRGCEAKSGRGMCIASANRYENYSIIAESKVGE